MKISDLETNIDLLKECELIRYIKKDNDLILHVVVDCEEDEHHHEEQDHEDDDDEECEEHDCCQGLNGHLYIFTFKDIDSLVIKGNECDNYFLKEYRNENNSIYLDYEGRNLYEDDDNLSLSFTYKSYKVEDGGKIEGPDV